MNKVEMSLELYEELKGKIDVLQLKVYEAEELKKKFEQESEALDELLLSLFDRDAVRGDVEYYEIDERKVAKYINENHLERLKKLVAKRTEEKGEGDSN